MVGPDRSAVLCLGCAFACLQAPGRADRREGVTGAAPAPSLVFAWLTVGQ